MRHGPTHVGRRICGGGIARRTRVGLRPSCRPRALTLPELVLSISIMSVLLGGIGSAMLLAGKTMPSGNAALIADAKASAALVQIASELSFASSVSTVSATVLEFSVPDRNHGAAGPELIRYQWSGTIGDPLYRRYNGGTPAIVVPSVNGLTFTPEFAAGDVPTSLRVLLVAVNAASLTSGDSARKSLLESWGMSVTTIDDDCTQSEFLTAAASCDVIYISHEINAASFRNKAFNVRRGVVIENAAAIADYGVGTGGVVSLETAMQCQSSSHMITQGMTGSVAVATLPSVLTTTVPSGSATALGTASLGGSFLVVADCGTHLNGGTPAAARRVKVPGGSLLYTVNALTDGGKKILARSLGWAGAPIRVMQVRIGIQTAQGSARDISAQLFSKPIAPP